MMNIFKKQDRISNGPELWGKVIEYLSPYFKDCVLAGGCVRDYYLGYPPKDIDVFCQTNDALEIAFTYITELKFSSMCTDEVKEFRKNCKPQINNIIPGIKRVETGSEYDLKSDGHDIQHVYYFDYLGYKINLITLRNSPITPIFITDTFDLNICKSAYYNGQIIDDPLAKFDRDNRVMTIAKMNSYGQGVQFARYTKFNKKYGGVFELRGIKEILNVRDALPANATLLTLPKSKLDTSVRYKVGLVTFYRSVNKLNQFRLWLNEHGNKYVLVECNTGYGDYMKPFTDFKYVQVRNLHKFRNKLRYFVLRVE